MRQTREDPLSIVEKIDREREAVDSRASDDELVILLHLWFWLGDAASGRLKRLPAGTNRRGKKRAFQNVRDVVQYLIQDYPDSEVKKAAIREMFSG